MIDGLAAVLAAVSDNAITLIQIQDLSYFADFEKEMTGDVFVFNAGDDRDTIKDFGRGQDRLELDDALWTGFKSAEDVVDDHARIKDGDIVLTFGDGDRLVLEDYTNLRALEELIDIV